MATVSQLIDSANLPLGNGVQVVQSDPAGLFALDKPEGVRSHPNANGMDPKALLTCSYDLEQETYFVPVAGGGTAPLYLLNRLDSPTSGLLLLASDPVLAESVRSAFSTRAVSKQYCALVRGRPSRPIDTWLDKLRKHRKDSNVRATASRSEGVTASTRVRLGWTKGMNPTVSMLYLHPLTGRTHQLRVQCSLRHFPILGDATYGDFNLNRRMGLQRLYLHSAKIEFNLQWREGKLSFAAESPLPADFRKLAASL
ncbi:MAG: RNA pseudouridine synthase [Verrucomicrobia bacterium]|nr:RNA pseudouridine synthase [Verrucomicrobiota bacterium]